MGRVLLRELKRKEGATNTTIAHGEEILSRTETAMVELERGQSPTERLTSGHRAQGIPDRVDVRNKILPLGQKRLMKRL